MNKIGKQSLELLIFLGNRYKKEGNSDGMDGQQLSKILNYTVEEINDAVENLDDQGLIKRTNYKAAPFIFGEILLNINGKNAYLDLKEEFKNESMKIFISHSSDDNEIAKRIIRLLKASLGLKPKDILCTSVDGHKLDPGINTDEILRKEVSDSKAFIGIITENSIKSSYVLFELGARWGAKLPMIPIICDNKGTSILSGPLKNINCLVHKTRGDIYTMVESISKTLNIEQLPANSFLDEIENIIQYDSSEVLKKNEKNIATAIDKNTKKVERVEIKIPMEIHGSIKARSQAEWKEDYEMVMHTIKGQTKAYLEYKNFKAPDIDKHALSRIISDAESEWSNDYEMVLHTIKEQVKSRRELDNQ